MRPGYQWAAGGAPVSSRWARIKRNGQPVSARAALGVEAPPHGRVRQTFSNALSATTAAVFLCALGLLPERFKLIKAAAFNGAASLTDCLLDKAEASLELGIGLPQRGFRVHFQVACQVAHRKQQVPQLLGHLSGIVLA